MAVTPDGQRAVSASDDETLKVWELDSGRELCTLRGHAGFVTAVAVTPDGRIAISASDDKTLKVWELDSGRELYTLRGHAWPVTAVAVTPDGQRAPRCRVTRRCGLSGGRSCTPCVATQVGSCGGDNSGREAGDLGVG